MTIKEYLSQAFTLDEQINTKIRFSEALSRQLRTDAFQHDGRQAVYEKIRALEDEIDADIDRLVDLKRDIYALIEKIPDARERMLLQLRYLTVENGRRPTWASIAQVLCYDERWVMRLHVRALETARKIWVGESRGA